MLAVEPASTTDWSGTLNSEEDMKSIIDAAWGKKRLKGMQQL